MEDKKESGASQPTQELKVKYILSAKYSHVFVDGIFGGVTPKGRIHAAVYSEKMVYPKSSSLSILPDGTPTENLPSADCVEREVIAGLDFDLNTARSVLKWLQEKVDTLEAALAGPEEETDE